MSIDTLMLLRTSFSAVEVRSALVHEPALADLGLTDYGEQVGVAGDRLSLVVQPWEEDDHDLIANGFHTATVTVTVVPKWGEEGGDAIHRVFATILRLVPGDIYLANQDAAGPGLLRLGSVVYVDPHWFRPEDLTDFDYHPERIVTGIPARVAAAAAE